MGKFLLIIILLGYLLYKFGTSVRVHSTTTNHQRPNQQKPSGGNVHIDAVPQKDKKRSDFKGGEYVDYEEVK
jgi:hypothetical protein